MKRLVAPWIWRVAWRDGRRSFGRLLRSMACVVIGIASLVAALSFRDNLAVSIQDQSKTLLGADLEISGREPFSPEAEALFASLGGDQSRQIAFSSMAYFPENGTSRLVQVRAISGRFPYYGALETEPASARAEFETAAAALVDENVMLQFNARVGSRLRIGDQEFHIAGKLKKIPGETLAFSLISPRVYIPLHYLDRSPLLQKGSLVRYRVYFKFDSRVDVDALVQRIAPQLEQLRLQSDTVKTRAAVIARSLDNLTRYLGLAVFVAVLLAGVGVASGVYVYAKEKTASVALLRCIGASAGETVAVYLIQTSIAAAAAACLGAALGVLVQAWLPLALRDFLPVTTALAFTPKAVGLGTLVGIGTALLFALLPLLPLRNVSPLQALRSAYEESRGARDPLLWLLFCVIVAAILSFAFIAAERWFHALYFTAGVLLAFGFIAFLAGTASVLMKWLLSDFLPFAWRQGLANLHRPNNQTVAVMLAIGVSVFLLMTLYNVQSTLLLQVAERGGQGEPNLVLFDVQKEQRAGIAELIQSFGARDYGEVPIVTLRLAAVKGRRVEEIRADGATPPWALRREYRSTYRERLARTERIIQGSWRDRVAPDTQPIPISVEKGIAETLRVGLNDLLEFDLQGVSLITQVASIREVDWQRVQPNFFAVFPVGVLEQAPQFYAVVSRIESPQRSAALQRAVAERFPNVSMIDLTLILNTLDAILGRVERAIRFVALFTILTGLSVLASAIFNRRGQRITESVLLRALGASKRQVLSIIAAEYLFLGAFSCLAGAALAALASWVLSFYFLGTVARFAMAPLLWVLLLTTATVLLFGAMGSWGIFRRPALEALRAET